MIANNERNPKNRRAYCVRFLGFSLIEMLVAISVFALIVPVAFTANAKSEEMKAIEEAKNLAAWLEHAFIRSNITKQRFQIIGPNALTASFNVSWISASAALSNNTETYESNGRALFLVPSGGNIEYNPLMGYNENQFGMTIRVFRGSDRVRSKIIRYVIISRFGRVRVSKYPP